MDAGSWQLPQTVVAEAKENQLFSTSNHPGNERFRSALNRVWDPTHLRAIKEMSFTVDRPSSDHYYFVLIIFTSRLI